jgi:peptide deformylase
MSILKVARMGHPVLRARARALDRADIKTEAVQKLIDDMIETMEEYHGIGLAATQVHEKVRVFIAGIHEDARSDEDEPAIVPVPMINPEVPRHRRIRVRFLDREGTRTELQLADLPARVVQHEYDHLDGVLFVDRMTSFETLTYLEEYAKYWRD